MSKATVESLPLTIVDGFAGGGHYNNIITDTEVKGSPFLILDAVKEAEVRANVGRRKPRIINAEYHFVEKVKPHYEYLEHEVNSSEYVDYLNSKVFLYQDDFLKVAPIIIKKIKNRNRAQRAIFILDQYAYKDVPFQIAKKILGGLQNSEIIMTFNYDSLQRYISDTPDNKKALENIGLAQHIEWSRLAQFKEAGLWKSAIQEQLANAIWKVSGAKHMTLFFVTPKNGSSYWLVHLSKLFRARDVMMNLHYKHFNTIDFSHHLNKGIFALGYKAVETPGQFNLDFSESFDFGTDARVHCIDQLSEDIPKLLYKYDRPVTFSELTDLIGSLTPASEAQIKSALQESIAHKEIVVQTESGGYRRKSTPISPKDNIEYKQHPLVFS